MSQGKRSTPRKFKRDFWRCDWCRIAFWGKDSYKEYCSHHCRKYLFDTHEAKYNYGDCEKYYKYNEYFHPKKVRRWRQVVKATIKFGNQIITE